MSTVIKEGPFQFTLKFYKVSHIFGFGIFFSTRKKKKAQDTHIQNTYLQPLRAFRGHTSITVLKVTGKPEPRSTPFLVMSAKEAGPTFSPPSHGGSGRREQPWPEVTDLLCQVTQRVTQCQPWSQDVCEHSAAHGGRSPVTQPSPRKHLQQRSNCDLSKGTRSVGFHSTGRAQALCKDTSVASRLVGVVSWEHHEIILPGPHTSHYWPLSQYDNDRATNIIE